MDENSEEIAIHETKDTHQKKEEIPESAKASLCEMVITDVIVSSPIKTNLSLSALNVTQNDYSNIVFDKTLELSKTTKSINVPDEVRKDVQKVCNKELVERTPQILHTVNSALKDISHKHYERLVEELKCPGCAYPMKSPIYLCNDGHSICDKCTRILLLCPLCKEKFTDMRSRTVEALCSKAQFKCSNAAGGCPIRLQIDLLPWHEKQCIYKPMKCFIGRVFGDCQWSGRETFWKEHLETEHADRMFFSDSANLILDMSTKKKALTGYYIFQVYDEMFNFYEIYDKDRVLFSMTCTSTQPAKKYQFAYEVNVVHPENEALAIAHKFPVHSEYDTDILAEGTCVNIHINNLTRFINYNKCVHYYVKVLEARSPMHSRICSGNKTQNLPIDFKQTNIQGVNLKNVPPDVILTRRLLETNSNVNDVKSDNELDRMGRQFNKKLAKVKRNDSGSESDLELEAFLPKKWGTPQLNFNHKYLKVNNFSDSSSNDSSNRIRIENQ